MAISTYQGTWPTTFIGPDCNMTVRLTSRTVTALHNSAETLKATYVVTVDDWDHSRNCPVWAVFDVRKFTKIHKGRSLPLAEKVFTEETSDAAVMYALAKLGGS